MTDSSHIRIYLDRMYIFMDIYKYRYGNNQNQEYIVLNRKALRTISNPSVKGALRKKVKCKIKAKYRKLNSE